MTNAISDLPSDLAFAERDFTMLKGGGMESDRPFCTWGQLVAMQKAGRGSELRKYALAMRLPGGPRDSIPGGGGLIAMPAEKQQKWYAQGYRAVYSVEDTRLVEFPVPPEPNFWMPSMVEESIQRGETIPEEMAPAGYIGPTLSIKAMRGQINAARAADMELPPVALLTDEDEPDAVTALREQLAEARRWIAELSAPKRDGFAKARAAKAAKAAAKAAAAR